MGNKTTTEEWECDYCGLLFNHKPIVDDEGHIFDTQECREEFEKPDPFEPE